MPMSGRTHHLDKDDVFANYTITHFCGRGAYGEVYLAEDISHKTVALKIIPIISGHEVWRAELIGLRHYRQAIENHTALIEVLHVGETDEFFYYTMEAADNMLHGDSDEYIADTLSHRLERGGRLEPDKVLELANTILDALEFLAQHDLAHRDIKPANIVYVNGQAKLSDIGLISNTGVRSKVVGTLDFLPPEIADGDPVGYGHDLYALGKVLYCALTGLLPENYPEVPLTVPLRAWRQFKNVLLRACSPDPRQRFYTSEEFRKELPNSIKPTTWVDESMEHVRTFHKQHPVAWRLGWTLLITTILALILNSFLVIDQQHKDRTEYRSRLDFVYRTIDLLNDHEIHLQRIAAASGNTARAWQLQTIAGLASEARAAGDLEATERYCYFADAILRRWSEEEFNFLCSKYPTEPLPEKSASLFDLLEAYSNFSNTPLAGYLMDSSAGELDEALFTIHNQLTGQWSGPIPGNSWRLNDDPDLTFSYIPAGGLPGEPGNSYWIGSNEVTCRVVRDLLPEYDLPLSMRSDDLPATEISWNDRLEVCYKLTQQARMAGTIPANFIYRLPYDNEWNFALHGAGQSAGGFAYEQLRVDEFAWFGGNSSYKLQPVRMLNGGALELFDMIGNAAESVLPFEPRAGRSMTAGNLGGSFRNRRINNALNERSDVDLLNNKWSGFRLVLGQGDMEYFDNAWYLGQTYIAHYDDSAYELLGGSRTRWTGGDVELWSKLLGGRTAVLSDKKMRTKLFNASQRLRELPSLVGGNLVGDSWLWQDSTPVKGGEWLNATGEDAASGNPQKYLVWHHGFWKAVGASEPVPLFILHYNELRKNQIADSKSPLILKDFTLSGKRYLLLRAPVDWYTAKRLAEMLGGRLACIENELQKKALLHNLRDIRNQDIALGGYRKYGQWYWLDKRKIKQSLPPNRYDRKISLNECFAAIRNGKICNAPEFDAFLMVMPLKDDHSGKK